MLPEHSIPAHEPQADRRMGGWTGTPFSQMIVGTRFPPQPLVRDADQVRRFGEISGWTAPPETVPALLLNELKSLKRFLKLPPGVLHAREELSLAGAARIGEALEVTVEIFDKFIKNEKRFVVVLQHVRSAEDGRSILSIKRTLYWPC